MEGSMGKSVEAVLPRSEYEGACHEHRESAKTIRDLLARVGDKWTLLVVSTLETGSLRFSELQRHIPGVSQRMLTRTLKSLERDGLVTRVSYPEVPPRVVYDLTPIGRTLTEPAKHLAAWAISNQDAIENARREYDERE